MANVVTNHHIKTTDTNHFSFINISKMHIGSKDTFYEILHRQPWKFSLAAGRLIGQCFLKRQLLK